MTSISGDGVDIVIRDGTWRVVPEGSSLFNTYLFQVTRGMNVLEYTTAFAEERKFPGTVLSVEYVRAVVIGYDERTRRWRLGVHLARNEADKSHWREIVRWPPGDNEESAAAAQQAGRELAEHIGCPLRIFGAKKPAVSVSGGPTGPLEPHQREDIGPQRVKLLARDIDLPAEYPGMWLGESRQGVTLKLGKELTAHKSGGELPAYTQCVVDGQQKLMRLMPPTGLLGAFLAGGQARQIESKQIRNVELRHTTSRRSETRQEADKMHTEITYVQHMWEVFLTLADESLLLAQTSHESTSDLTRRRASSTGDLSKGLMAGIDYLRQHQEDQRAYEAAEEFAESTAIIIASTLDKQVVKTAVGP